MKKYEILKDEYNTIRNGNRKLHRIKALKEFTTIHGRVIAKGEIGGYIESEDNLSQHGDCWVCDNAKVYDEACVTDDAVVCDRAEVNWHAIVMGEAQINGYAQVSDYAQVSENAKICDKAAVAYFSQVSGNTFP